MWVAQTTGLVDAARRIAICSTESESEETSYKEKNKVENKRFVKIIIQQNNDPIDQLLWDDIFSQYRKDIATLKDKVIVVSAVIKFSDYSGANSLNSYKSTVLQIN